MPVLADRTGIFAIAGVFCDSGEATAFIFTRVSYSVPVFWRTYKVGNKEPNNRTIKAHRD